MGKIDQVFVFAVVDHSSEGDKTGVSKKVYGQIAAFEDLGYSVVFIHRDDNGYWLANSDKNLIRVSAKLTPYNYRIKDEIAGYLCQYFLQNGFPCFTYVRGTRLFKHCRQLLKTVKENGGNIVVEIPTVTKLITHKVPRDFIAEVIDRIAMTRLRNEIDGIVVMSHDKKLFGIPTIKIDNGIDVSRVKPLRPKPHQGVHLLGVAMMQMWHGYERVIEGLHQYYATETNPEEIYLDLVGEGPETPKYKELTDQYGLQDKVLFHGVLHGDELDKIYNECDIGIGSFGMYKLSITEGSILKLKEYCAKGIPFIYACHEDTLDPSPHFCRLYANNETSIDIRDVLSFYHGLEGNLDKVRQEMKLYAEEKLSWKKEMAHVIEQVEKQRTSQENSK